jgi:hypothetical protein
LWETGFPQLQNNSTSNADVHLLPVAEGDGFQCQWSENAKGNPYESCRASRERRKGASYGGQHHGKGEHDKGHDVSTTAHEHSTEAHRHSTDAHGKSGEHRTKNNPWFPGAAMPRPSGSDFSVNRSLLRWRLLKTRLPWR